jgi:AcrR family transcriptional regulator
MPYHHGDLRRSLVAAAVDDIAAHGPANLSVRRVAAAAGVSHTAAAHHFGDKAGLLTAVAADGHRLLTAAMERAKPTLLDAGIAYVRFADQHRAHFAVMFDPSLVHQDDADLAGSSTASFAVVRRLAGSDDGAIAAWSFVHGLATLHVAGALPRSAPRRPDTLVRRAAAGFARLGR